MQIERTLSCHEYIKQLKESIVYAIKNNNGYKNECLKREISILLSFMQESGKCKFCIKDKNCCTMGDCNEGLFNRIDIVLTDQESRELFLQYIEKL